MQPVYVAVNPHEKAMQRALIQYRNPKNYDLVVEALTKAGRTDLIGFDKHCLVRPRGIGYGRTNAKDRYAGGDKNRRTAGGGNNAEEQMLPRRKIRKRQSAMFIIKKQVRGKSKRANGERLCRNCTSARTTRDSVLTSI